MRRRRNKTEADLAKINNYYTIKPVKNNHTCDPKIVAVVDMWSLFSGNLCNSKFKAGFHAGGRYSEVVIN